MADATPVTGPSSREAAFLDHVEARAGSGFAISVACAVTGALLLAISSSTTAERLGALAIACGLLLAWSFSRYRALCLEARACLAEPSRQFLFERRYVLSKSKAWQARLWATDSPEHAFAELGWLQWSKRLYMTADKVPATVYGAPSSRAAVVVSCPEGVVVGRIGWSTFGRDSLRLDPPRGLAWLFKPRRLPLSRR
jgi:hypothetical protein